MAFLRALAAAVAVSPLLAGCSGAADTVLFDSPGSTGADASFDAPTTGGRDAGGTTQDSGAPSVEDTGVRPDAGGGDPGVQCGASACDPASAVCCRVGTGGGATTYACTPASGCTEPAALAIPCDDAVDCVAAGEPAGTVCCVTEDAQTGHATKVACVPPSSCVDQTQTWLCDPSAAGACPQGMTCSVSKQTIPGYDICHP